MNRAAYRRRASQNRIRSARNQHDRVLRPPREGTIVSDGLRHFHATLRRQRTASDHHRRGDDRLTQPWRPLPKGSSRGTQSSYSNHRCRPGSFPRGRSSRWVTATVQREVTLAVPCPTAALVPRPHGSFGRLSPSCAGGPRKQSRAGSGRRRSDGSAESLSCPFADGDYLAAVVTGVTTFVAWWSSSPAMPSCSRAPS